MLTAFRGCSAFEPACALPSGVIRGLKETIHARFSLPTGEKVDIPIEIRVNLAHLLRQLLPQPLQFRLVCIFLGFKGNPTSRWSRSFISKG